MDIVLVHGYNVTSTKTYGNLAVRLKKLGYKIKNVYLSKYITLDDDLDLKDIVRAFQAALVDLYGAQLGKKKFACVTHSTGGVVVRSWIDRYYSQRSGAIPISHLIMLAPPGHGSRLSSLGKSRLSRLRSLWGVEPGLRILDALELGSQFLWDLNSAWMGKKFHKAAGFYTFVIAGQWIDKKLWDTIIPATYERGSDGVVRTSSCNLNMQRILFDGGKIKKDSIDGVPFLITPRTSHANEDYGIIGSIPLEGTHPVLDAILSALDVGSKREYERVEAEFALRTLNLQSQETYFDGSVMDRYCQIVFRIRDNMGNNLNDYAVEFIDSSGRGDRFLSGFFADHHKNQVNPENFVYYLSFDKAQGIPDGKLGFRVQSVPDTDLVSYEDFDFRGAYPEVRNILKPNQTTFVDIVMRRRLNKNIFRLTSNLSYQKIKPDPSPDWIE